MERVILAFGEELSNHSDEDRDRIVLHETSDLMPRFFNILGSTAVNALSYIEKLEASMKEAKQKRDAKREEKRKRDRENNEEQDEDDDLEKAMGGQGQAEEFRIEQIRDQAETSLLNEKGLLGNYVEAVSTIVKHTKLRAFRTLFRQALLCWCKFMVVSRKFCEDELWLLWKLLAAEDVTPENKCNIVISLGDMCCRFPNTLDPHLKYIYELLKSNEPSVKKITLMVLTHLILNDMIKIKAFVSDIVILMEDPIDEIQRQAKFFFHELSKKNKNQIYNILPDIISRLCEEDASSVDFEKFKKLMKSMFEFKFSLKQMENLVDKLLKRLHSARRQNHDV